MTSSQFTFWQVLATWNNCGAGHSRPVSSQRPNPRPAAAYLLYCNFGHAGGSDDWADKKSPEEVLRPAQTIPMKR